MAIRDVSYYGWEQNDILRSTPSEVVTSAAIVKSKQDVSGTIWAIGNVARIVGEVSSKAGALLKTTNKIDWEVVEEFPAFSASNLAFDSAENMYIVGSEDLGAHPRWQVFKSTTKTSGSFSTIDYEAGTFHSNAHDIAIDSQDNIYVVGYRYVNGNNYREWLVKSSTTGLSGSFSVIDGYVTNNGNNDAHSVAVDSSDNVYVAGSEQGFLNGPDKWRVRKSTTGASASFSTVDFIGDAFDNRAYVVRVDPVSDDVYVGGFSGSARFLVRKSTTGASGSFSDVDLDFGFQGACTNIEFRPEGTGVYAFGFERPGPSIRYQWLLRKSDDGSADSFFTVANPVVSASVVALNTEHWHLESGMTVDNDDEVLLFGTADGTKRGVYVRGKLTSNSASIGPRMLNTSFGYVQEEIKDFDIVKFQRSTVERFNLNNVSEFPHSSGVHQMRNVILGTSVSGRVGRDEEDLIQLNHVGSVVKVMWPKQDSELGFVKGYGDFSAGEKSGKLSNNFAFGDFIEVTEYDHCALYAYLIKQVSGTLDDVEIKIERRPLRNVPFTIEQSIEYESSGSDTKAKLKDIVYSKEVNYGDLAITEVGFPIDVPLENVRDFRISARHKNGQADDKNTNLIVWGRFIKSEEET